MVSRDAVASLLGPLCLLILIYLIWLFRYPIWAFSEFIEPLFLMLTLSYGGVLLLSICFAKKEATRPLRKVLKGHGFRLIPISMVFAGLFQAVWFLIALTIGGNLEISSFPDLSGYEQYAVASLPVAATLYGVFAVFGAFVEEVTFRGYVQSRVGSQYGPILGVVIASLLFSLQHIHIFHSNWILEFFQTQFLYVFCFGIFVGYLFIKNEHNIWSVFTFHAIVNLIDIVLPIQITYTIPFSPQIVTITSFAFTIILLRLVHIEELFQTPASAIPNTSTSQ